MKSKQAITQTSNSIIEISFTKATIVICLFWAAAIHQSAKAVANEEFEKYATAKTCYVINENVETLAAPTDQAYRTGTIHRGDVIEVHGKLGEDWFAIRPPVGQYDWVIAQSAHLLPGGKVAEIVDTATPAWIHTDDESREKFQWQIKLQPSQQVNVIAQVNQQIDQGRSRAWYKIDPPPGEFRWVNATAVSDQPPKFREKVVAPLIDVASESSVIKSSVQSASVADESAVLQASGRIIQMSTEPVVLAPGEIVVNSDDEYELVNDTGDYYEGGMESSILVGDTGEYFEGYEEEYVGPMGCDGCDPSCQNDFDDVKRRIKPVGRFLGMFGLALVEAERTAEAMPCTSCGVVGCTSCVGGSGYNRAASIGSLPSRLDNLPRPLSRLRSDSVDRGLLIDRLGDAREQLREGFSDVRESVSSVGPLSSPTPAAGGPAAVSLGNPVGPGKQSLLTESKLWQGLPFNGVPSTDLELDVQSPTGTEQWAKRPENAQVPSSQNPSDQGGTLIQTSTPANGDQSSYTPSGNSNFASAGLLSSDIRFTSRLLQQASAELTTIVARPTEQWQLQPLRQQVSLWIENGADPIARGEARLLRDRIDQLEEFRSRWLRANSSAIAQMSNTTNALSTSSAPMTQVNQVSFQRSVSIDPNKENGVVQGGVQFNMNAAKAIIDAADASGWLVAVHGQREDFPKFALTDDAGRLVAYVEAPPGTNLRVYLQQPVAIHGQRGMHAVLNMRTIMAERIVRIADAR